MAEGMRFFFTALTKNGLGVQSGYFDCPLPYPNAKPSHDILRMVEEMLDQAVGGTPHIHEWKYAASVERPTIIFTAQKDIPNARNSCRPN